MIVCCGEALIDLVTEGGLTYSARAGGSALIAALAGARMGGDFAILARVSKDAFGQRIRQELQESGVATDLLVDAVEQTTLAVAAISTDGNASYSFYMKGTADWNWTSNELILPAAPALALLVGSMSMEVEPGRGLILELAESCHSHGHTTVLFDPNTRLQSGSLGASNAEATLPFVDIVKVSEEDMSLLYPGHDPAEVALKWAGLGPDLVCLTKGASGVVAYRPDHPPLSVASPSVDVADTIGAGDTFCAALLFGLQKNGLLGSGSRERRASLSRETIRRLLQLACAAAALACENIGASPPQAWSIVESLAFDHPGAV